MSLGILVDGPGVYRVVKSDVECLSGITVVPVRLLEEFYPGGASAFVEASGLSQHIAEVDGFLFIASGSFGYGIGNLGSLRSAHFECGQDFVNIQVGDSPRGWYRGTKLDRGFTITIDPSLVEASISLRENSEPGRIASAARIADSAAAPEFKFLQLTALLSDPAPGSGKRVVLAVEEAMLKAVVDQPQVLLSHLRHDVPAVREAIATVLGRLRQRSLSANPDGLHSRNSSKDDGGDWTIVLQALSKDPDTWVRIKAERILGSEQTIKVCPLGNACIGLNLSVEQKWTSMEIGYREQEIERLFLGKVRRRVKAPQPDTQDWLRNPELVERHLAVTTGRAPASCLHYDVDTRPGWKGDELFVSAFQWFMSDTHRESYGVWPGRGTVGFAVFNDTKGVDGRCELFRIWRAEFPSASSVRLAIEALPPSVSAAGYELPGPWCLVKQRRY